MKQQRGYRIRSVPTAIGGAVIAFSLAGCLGDDPLVVRDTIAATSPAMPRAATAAALTGQWQGMTQAGRHTDIGTELAIDARSATLQYGAPLQCRIDIRRAGASADGDAYDVVGANGGWCDGALAGRLWVTPGENASVSIKLLDDTGKPLGSGSLAAAATR